MIRKAKSRPWIGRSQDCLCGLCFSLVSSTTEREAFSSRHRQGYSPSARPVHRSSERRMSLQAAARINPIGELLAPGSTSFVCVHPLILAPLLETYIHASGANHFNQLPSVFSNQTNSIDPSLHQKLHEHKYEFFEFSKAIKPNPILQIFF